MKTPAQLGLLSLGDRWPTPLGSSYLHNLHEILWFFKPTDLGYRNLERQSHLWRYFCGPYIS